MSRNVTDQELREQVAQLICGIADEYALCRQCVPDHEWRGCPAPPRCRNAYLVADRIIALVQAQQGEVLWQGETTLMLMTGVHGRDMCYTLKPAPNDPADPHAIGRAIGCQPVRVTVRALPDVRE